MTGDKLPSWFKPGAPRIEHFGNAKIKPPLGADPQAVLRREILKAANQTKFEKSNRKARDLANAKRQRKARAAEREKIIADANRQYLSQITA